MKRSLAFLWIAALVFACVGCGNTAEVETSSGGVGKTRITISAGADMLAERAVRTALPDIELAYCDRIGADELAVLLSTKDESVDIYRVPADFLYSSLMAKELTLDLSASPSIAERAETMDESVRAVIRDNAGRIAAYPASLQIYAYGVKESYWRLAFGERPLPETFGEMLDAWIDWEREIAESYPDILFANCADPFDYPYLVSLFTRLFVMQNGADGLSDERAEPLISALRKLETVRALREDMERSAQATNTGEVGSDFICCVTTKTAMEDIGGARIRNTPYGEMSSGTTWLPLRFGENPDARTHAYMELFAVNPYSRNGREAISVIESLSAMDTDPLLFYALHPQCAEPYENPEYPDRRERAALRAEEYEAALRRAEEAGEDASKLREELSIAVERLESVEAERYWISTQTIADFRSAVSARPLDLHVDSPFFCEAGTALDGVLLAACERYADGAIDAEAFLRELAAKMDLAYRENT